jgi:hypothetical protein
MVDFRRIGRSRRLMTITGNIPSAASMRVDENFIGQTATLRMGAHSVRIGAGIGSMDILHPKQFPIQGIADVLARLGTNHLAAQWLLGGAPHNSGQTSDIPDKTTWMEMRRIWQGVVDQIHAVDPHAVFEIANEPDGVATPSIGGVPIWQLNKWPKGTIPFAWFEFLAFVIAGVHFHGHKLCVHLVGSGGANQIATAHSWKFRDNGAVPNDAAAAIIAAVKASGGWIAYNTYPNQTDAFTGTVNAFTTRYLTVTWPNTQKAHMASVMSVLPCKIGEVGVKETATLSGDKLQGLRQGLISALTKAGLDFTWFAILTTDAVNGAGFGACNLDGTPVIRDLAFTHAVVAIGGA